MRNKLIFLVVAAGIVLALVSAYVYAVPAKPLPPAFNPAPNPYAHGIYANGIVESFQNHGENINLYPEVSGTVVDVPVAEGQVVTEGMELLKLDDSIQRALAEQQEAQAQAAHAVLEELHAQPRKETLEVARAQVALAAASLKTAHDTLDKLQQSVKIAPESVSKDTLDTAINTEKTARANLGVATRQYELTKAGAWSYDIENQERQWVALSKAAAASKALLGKFTIRAPTDGVVLSIATAVGSYVSPQGAYDAYTQGMVPTVVMGTSKGVLAVRVYVDEVLIPRLPSADKIEAQMFIRGTSTKIPLRFVRVQPFVSPKIQLSNQRQEKVDVRVLPVIFRFDPPPGSQIFSGQLVDVYVGEK